MHHAGSFIFAILILTLLETKADETLQNGAELADKRAWTNFNAGYGKRAWNHFAGGYGKRGWNHFVGNGYGKRGWNGQFAAGYGRRSFDDDEDLNEDEYQDELNELDQQRPDKRAWNSGFAGGMGKRAWNSGFAGAMGKRAWNSGFAGGMGKRAWNSGFSGAMGKRAWNSGFSGALGKRAWNSGFVGGLGKRSPQQEFDDEYDEESMMPAETSDATGSAKLTKRNWSSLGVRGAWGKRNTQQYLLVSHDDYNKWLNDNFAKRTRGWVALRGMWGKRSDPEMTKKAPIPKVTEEEAKQILQEQQQKSIHS